MEKRTIAGIDVGCGEVVVAIDRGRGPVRVERFANDPTGHRRLCRLLTRRGAIARVCIEATGIYHLDLALTLHATPGIEVMVANPRASNDFARAQLQRSKTDRTDAQSILEYVRRMEFAVWEPPAPAILNLQALSRRISALLVTRAQEKNRLHAIDHVVRRAPALRESIERLIDALNGEVEMLTQAALEILETMPLWHRRFDHLVSVKGIAQASAITLLAELAVLPADMTARQWVAHAGLDPRHCESGSSVRGQTRISKVGNRHLRAALFMPALVASRHEPCVRAFYGSLLERGKKPLQAVVAVMRKLLHAIHGMFRHGADFDGEKFYASRT